MTDFEMTKLCAEAMGLPPLEDGSDYGFYEDSEGTVRSYAPLYNAMQAMELLTTFKLVVEPDGEWSATWINTSRVKGLHTHTVRYAPTVNRAIVECVAKLQIEKQEFAASASPTERNK